MAWRFALLLLFYALYPWLLAIGMRSRRLRDAAASRLAAPNDYEYNSVTFRE
jgi:hypothetical protein